MKEISLNDTVYNLVKQYPEIRELIISLGFEPLRSDKMLNTAGRIMTIGKASSAMMCRRNYSLKRWRKTDSA